MKWLLAMLGLGAVTALAADVPTPATPALSFTQVRLGKAVLSLPPHWTTLGNAVPLWLHLHGAPAVMETNFASFGAPGILLNVTLPGLSKVYADHFASDQEFPRLLAEVESELRRLSPGRDWRVGRIVVSSFSAGFGGVRQLLRQPVAFDRIDALVMADSIYCGYSGDPAAKHVDAELMAGFLRFARLAVEGQKRMLISHSRQVPDGYASTTETADYLLRELKLSREEGNEPPGSWPAGLVCLSRGAHGRFAIVGFDGAAAEDHMRHLRGIGALLRQVQD